MGCSDVPTAVFIDTNLGTRLAVPASPDITAEDFKREVERTHLNCFPEFGTIRVKEVMVTKKLQHYHLSGSLPLKYAFLGSNATWFLQTSVILSNVSACVESPKHNEAEVCNPSSAANVTTDSVELVGASLERRSKCKRKKVKEKSNQKKKVKEQRFPYLKASLLKISTASCFRRKRKRNNVKKKPKTRHPRRGRMQRSLVEKEMLDQFVTEAEVNSSKNIDSNVIAEATGETISEPGSVSGIIKKYFSDYDEVASNPDSLFTTVQYKRRKQLDHSTGCECPNMQSGIMMLPITAHIPPQVPQDLRVKMPSSEASREKHKTPDVGKHLLLASNSLGLTPNSRRSILSLCQYNNGESPLCKFTATVQNLVFEMADEGD